MNSMYESGSGTRRHSMTPFNPGLNFFSNLVIIDSNVCKILFGKMFSFEPDPGGQRGDDPPICFDRRGYELIN